METYLYDVSIPAISALQSGLADHAGLMESLSVALDPKYAFLVYAPALYLLDARLGKRLVLTLVLAEWSNQLLKWLLAGERPYWYVHSSGRFDTQQVRIEQFPATCELGPGQPSGHAMVAAAVWYIVADALRQSAWPRWLPLGPGAKQAGLWLAYGLLLGLLSLSRVFLGCHFPHQCLAGACLGALLARLVSRWEARPSHFLWLAGGLFASAFGTYGLLGALGRDPGWTIKLATQHCARREYIHLDTTPLFSAMRYCGFALGTGLGLALRASGWLGLARGGGPAAKPASRPNLSWLSARLVTALLMARLVDNLGLFVSHSNLAVFYAAALASYALFACAFINL